MCHASVVYMLSGYEKLDIKITRIRDAAETTIHTVEYKREVHFDFGK